VLALELISEPEAAALAVLDVPEITQRQDIIETSRTPQSPQDRPLTPASQLGDIYLVADCGGGTVVRMAGTCAIRELIYFCRM